MFDWVLYTHLNITFLHFRDSHRQYYESEKANSPEECFYRIITFNNFLHASRVNKV